MLSGTYDAWRHQPGLLPLPLEDTAKLAASVVVPLNVLRQPGVAPDVLGARGVARNSTGSVL